MNAVTYTAAKAINRHGQIGVLCVGREADITVFKVNTDATEIGVDAFGKERTMKMVIEPKFVLRAGTEHPIVVKEQLY